MFSIVAAGVFPYIAVKAVSLSTFFWLRLARACPGPAASRFLAGGAGYLPCEGALPGPGQDGRREMDGFLDERAPDPADPDPERVKSRAKTIRRESPENEDAEESAEELLKESDARTASDPAPKELEEDRVERRTSEEATPPATD